MLAQLVQTLGLHKVTTRCKTIIKQHVSKLKKHSIHFKEDPHYTRKSLKVLFYWINLFPNQSVYSKKQVKKLDNYLDKLGEWHDMAVACIKIKHFRKDHLPKLLPMRSKTGVCTCRWKRE